MLPQRTTCIHTLCACTHMRACKSCYLCRRRQLPPPDITRHFGGHLKNQFFLETVASRYARMPRTVMLWEDFPPHFSARARSCQRAREPVRSRVREHVPVGSIWCALLRALVRAHVGVRVCGCVCGMEARNFATVHRCVSVSACECVCAASVQALRSALVQSHN